MPVKRAASKAAASRISANSNNRSESAAIDSSRGSKKSLASKRQLASSDNEETAPPQTKRRKTGAATKEQAARLHERLFGRLASSQNPVPTCDLPTRAHAVDYHRPLLLYSESGRAAQESLLQWFDSVSSARSMPWRKPWVDPGSVPDPEALRATLERRAYEVWISEIMLQQTRVAVVIDYWNRWMAKWPTIHDLAAADPEDVLAAWRGLGYYSRATRIHEAAKKVVSHPRMKGLLPEDAKTLEAEVPGVGRYTAGAICSIVFGRPEPMVDGNVLRVLSRQLGLLGNVKADKSVIDSLWAAAEALVEDVAREATEDGNHHDSAKDVPKSDRPGRWGQGLMELGSTVCAPKPNCGDCPITSTCRAYMEGQAFAAKSAAKSRSTKSVADIEDACRLCEPLVNIDDEPNNEQRPVAPPKAESKQSTLASFAFTSSRATSKKANSAEKPSKSHLEAIVEHARKFPVKIAKKAVREEETLVCAIRRDDGSYLIHRRPEKGLLAGLWEFPSRILDTAEAGDSRKRKKLALSFVSDLVGVDDGAKVDHVGELGSIPWLFSHLKLTMHVHLFHVHGSRLQGATRERQERPSRWSSDVDQESMGTGMRKCWLLVKDCEP